MVILDKEENQAFLDHKENAVKQVHKVQAGFLVLMDSQGNLEGQEAPVPLVQLDLQDNQVKEESLGLLVQVDNLDHEVNLDHKVNPDLEVKQDHQDLQVQEDLGAKQDLKDPRVRITVHYKLTIIIRDAIIHFGMEC